MPSYSEDILTSINKISVRDTVSLFEAAVMYCEEQDLEIEEMVDYLDANAKAQVRQSALDTNRVRKCVETPNNALEFE